MSLFPRTCGRSPHSAQMQSVKNGSLESPPWIIALSIRRLRRSLATEMRCSSFLRSISSFFCSSRMKALASRLAMRFISLANELPMVHRQGGSDAAENVADGDPQIVVEPLHFELIHQGTARLRRAHRGLLHLDVARIHIVALLHAIRTITSVLRDELADLEIRLRGLQLGLGSQVLRDHVIDADSDHIVLRCSGLTLDHRSGD